MMDVEIYREEREVEKEKEGRRAGGWRGEDVRKGEQRWGVSRGWTEGLMRSGRKD